MPDFKLPEMFRLNRKTFLMFYDEDTPYGYHLFVFYSPEPTSAKGAVPQVDKYIRRKATREEHETFRRNAPEHYFPR